MSVEVSLEMPTTSKQEVKAPAKVSNPAMDAIFRAVGASHIDGIGSEVVSSNYREGDPSTHNTDSYNVRLGNVAVTAPATPVTAPVTSARPVEVIQLLPLRVPTLQANDRERVAAS